jgi:hypothetical protein
MVGAIKVRLVEDQSTLHLMIALAGPVFVAVAAVTAAAIAARTAGRRQERQLLHDRDIRREEHRRDAVDTAVEIANGVRGHYVVFRSIFKSRERLDPEESAEKFEAASERLSAAWDEMSEGMEEFLNATVRLQLRFPREHPIIEAARALVDLWAALASVTGPLARASDEQSRELLKSADDECGKGYEQFMDTCAAWLSGGDQGAVPW